MMDLPQELEQVIERMDEAGLHVLLAHVRERLKFVHQMQDLRSLQQFHVFDEVVFHRHGEHIAGMVIRINRRSVTVKTADRGEWKVSPVFLTRIREASPASESRNMSPSHNHHHDRHADTTQLVAPEKDLFAEVSRNAPCPCGSGRKYKKCHGK